jgi:signal peptidase I
MEGVKVNRKLRREIDRKKSIAKTLKYIGNTATAIVCGILIFIIITSCITLFDAATHPGKTPSVFGYKQMTVLTGSMKPQINPGDLVIVKNIKDLNTIGVGTIVTYKNKENVLITHRVSELNNKDGVKTYITKGDANPAADVEAVTQNQLEGVYVTNIPYLGYFNMFVKSGIGIIFLILVPLILIMGLEIKNYFKKSVTKSV